MNAKTGKVLLGWGVRRVLASGFQLLGDDVGERLQPVSRGRDIFVDLVDDQLTPSTHDRTRLRSRSLER
jgi:hypothetical protein